MGPLTVASAFQLAYDGALADSMIGTVGLEIEGHLIDSANVQRRVSWSRLLPAVREAGRTCRSTVTVEPGGQVELSGPPANGVAAAVDAMRADEHRLRSALGQHDFHLLLLGADPLRAPRRINPRPRYRAIERHFAATGHSSAGKTMMCSTAALQINLQAGPRAGWPARLALAHQIGPTLIAISANSRWTAGRDSGWASARQRAWWQLDRRTSGPIALGPDPSESWARYALDAPVLFIQTDRGATVSVHQAVPFSSWVSGEQRLGGRFPNANDLVVHLTTLFPPVRLRGYVELRYLDATDGRWWPAVAALVATLMDDPVAAAAAAEATESTSGMWETAARVGLTHPALAESARRCLDVAADRAPDELRATVADLAALVNSGRSPGQETAEHLAAAGPRAGLEQLCTAPRFGRVRPPRR
jgi:glutamate--cysteine ligase